MVIPEFMFQLLPGLILIAIGVVYYVIAAVVMVAEAVGRVTAEQGDANRRGRNEDYRRGLKGSLR